jgi:hypothetical protein
MERIKILKIIQFFSYSKIKYNSYYKFFLNQDVIENVHDFSISQKLWVQFLVSCFLTFKSFIKINFEKFVYMLFLKSFSERLKGVGGNQTENIKCWENWNSEAMTEAYGMGSGPYGMRSCPYGMGSCPYGMGYPRGSKMAAGCPLCWQATPEMAVKPFRQWPNCRA